MTDPVISGVGGFVVQVGFTLGAPGQGEKCVAVSYCAAKGDAAQIVRIDLLTVDQARELSKRLAQGVAFIEETDAGGR